jgi:Co/Zn/Cd efflux system component
VLLDRVPDQALCDRLQAAIRGSGDVQIHDFHLWQVGPGRYASIVSVSGAVSPAEVRRRIGEDRRLVHLTVEVA